jgi:AMP phosphorylase
LLKGGVPGNKVSLLIVPIVAAAGLTIPKSSTRAITSPSGTADSMEVLAPVAFSPEELNKIVSEENACIIWGGALETAPADNILIEIERPLHMDPIGLMIPSILTKKLSLGVKKLVLDIPVGNGTKFITPDKGKQFAYLFKEIAANVGIEAECALTLANQPIGHAVGPALEAREALNLLRDYSKGPNSLIEKSTDLAGILLEMSGKANKGMGQIMAKKILKSGKAYEKMKRIIKVQGGNPEITPEDIKLGPHIKEFFSSKEGYIVDVNNSIINQIAKAAGCPISKTSGIEIIKKQGAKIKEGEIVFRIYSHSDSKLRKAEKIYNATGGPIRLGGMVIERI